MVTGLARVTTSRVLRVCSRPLNIHMKIAYWRQASVSSIREDQRPRATYEASVLTLISS